MGTLHPVFARVIQRWMGFMVQIGESLDPHPFLSPCLLSMLWPCSDFSLPGCASVSRSSTHMVSRFLLPSVLSEFTTLVISMAGDTSVRVFEQHL